MPDFIRQRPWIFYDFFIIFFSACLAYDIINESVTGFTWGWGICLVYYVYRRGIFKEEVRVLRGEAGGDD
jgi:hypothetical protein